MNKVIKLFEGLKKLLLWITKACYLLFATFSFCILSVNMIKTGSILPDYEEVGVIFGSLIFAFTLWLLHIWTKNTKYVGFIMALAFYWALWTYVPFLHSVLEGTSQAFINFIKHLF